MARRSTRGVRRTQQQGHTPLAPPVDRIVQFARDLLTSSTPQETLYRFLRTKDQWSQTIEEAQFPGNMLRLSRENTPHEIALMTEDEVIFGHWTRELHLPGRNDSQGHIRKFLQHPHEISVGRILHSPSLACPDFMPAAAKDEPLARRALGQALIRQADFVFGNSRVGEEPGSNELVGCFRKFAGHMSDARTHGLEHVRRLTFPHFGQHFPSFREDAIVLVRDCPNLKVVRIGLEVANVADLRYDVPHRIDRATLPEMEAFVRSSGLGRLCEATVERVTFVQGQIPEGTQLSQADYHSFVVDLCKDVKRRFLDAGKANVAVELDSHHYWAECGSSKIQTIG